jgi:hypothetical protein
LASARAAAVAAAPPALAPVSRGMKSLTPREGRNRGACLTLAVHRQPTEPPESLAHEHAAPTTTEERP